MSLADELAQTTRLAVPLALTQLAGMAISVTDVVMSGWLGARFLAAEALATNFFIPMFFIGMGLAAAVAPMTAQAIARGDHRGARRSLRQGLWMIAIISLPVMLVLAMAESLIKLFGQEYLFKFTVWIAILEGHSAVDSVIILVSSA